jgi:hypothetical protein
MQNQNCKGEENNGRSRYFLGGSYYLISHHLSSPTQLHCLMTRNISNHRHSFGTPSPLQQHLPQQEIQRTGQSAQARSSSLSSSSDRDRAQ